MSIFIRNMITGKIEQVSEAQFKTAMKRIKKEAGVSGCKLSQNICDEGLRYMKGDEVIITVTFRKENI